jgi:DNA-binding transcriptional regulator LsrR (DeoR family)
VHPVCFPKPGVAVNSSTNGSQTSQTWKPQARSIHPSNGREQYELLRWVAELYYMQQQGQAEIASLIGVSVSKISRLLAEARRQGIVTIQVAPPRSGDSELEVALARQLGLRAVHVAPARVTDGSAASRLAALMAARLLPRLLPSQGVIGLSGGYTVAQMARALEPLTDSDLTVIPLQGNWYEGGLHLHNDEVVRDAASQLGARALSLPAPMVVERTDTRDALLQDRSIRAVADRWSDLAVAVVGIGGAPGAASSDSLSVMGQLPTDVQSELAHEGVVGDMCAHMFDAHGRFVEHEASRRTVSIPIELLRSVPTVVAVAGGANKAASLLGAARSGVPHVLITDQLAAERLQSLL